MSQFVCDTCTYPSLKADHCDSPACLANPTLSEPHKARLRAAEDKLRAEAQERAERLQRRARMRAQGFTTAF
jgi:hypothetical protein